MSRIKVDFDDLMMALETAEGMMEWYLDKETGYIFMLADEFERDDMDTEYVEKMEEDPDRFVYVEPIPSYEAHPPDLATHRRKIAGIGFDVGSFKKKKEKDRRMAFLERIRGRTFQEFKPCRHVG